MATLSAPQLIDEDDRVELTLGGPVSQLKVDFAFTLVVDVGDAGAVEIAIEHPFALQRPDNDPAPVEWQDDAAALAPALALLHVTAESAAAFKDGRLELRLADGLRLLVGAGGDFEPWSLVGPAGLRVVSAPGGELAVWSPEA
jgi:hypothetical protein